eukprot:4393508-Karenia_brevis.AAC.1
MVQKGKILHEPTISTSVNDHSAYVLPPDSTTYMSSMQALVDQQNCTISYLAGIVEALSLIHI